MIWSWKLKLRIENGNATEKLQDKNLQAPQAAYIIKSSFCMHWSLKGKYFISFEEYILEYLNIIMIDQISNMKYQRLKIKK